MEALLVMILIGYLIVFVGIFAASVEISKQLDEINDGLTYQDEEE